MSKACGAPGLRTGGAIGLPPQGPYDSGADVDAIIQDVSPT